MSGVENWISKELETALPTWAFQQAIVSRITSVLLAGAGQSSSYQQAAGAHRGSGGERGRNQPAADTDGGQRCGCQREAGTALSQTLQINPGS